MGIRLLSLLGLLLTGTFAFCDSPQVDIVYTWVNGADPVWHKSRQEWFERMNPDAPKTSDAAAPKRFRDRDELRYSLRSIARYAPFVHHIYIVTCGQRPEWLTEHPLVTIVDHKAIFRSTSDLPTFNSMAIEANLHRIPNLSEYYVYFNDDVFLTKASTVATFFTEDGRPRLFFSEHKLPSGVVVDDDNGYFAACKNTANLLNTVYGKTERYTHAHTPFPCRKSIVGFIEGKFPQIFALVSSHRFRSRNGFTLTNGLIPYVSDQLHLGEVSAANNMTWLFGKSLEKDLLMKKQIDETPPQFMCIQDVIEDESRAEIVGIHLKQIMRSLFPTPAHWEKIEQKEELSQQTDRIHSDERQDAEEDTSEESEE